MSDQPNDKELFESAISETPEAPGTPVAETQPETQPRDESGRFASKEVKAELVEAAPAPVAEQQPEKEAHIPSWRLKEEADNRRRFEELATQRERENWQLQQEMTDLRRRFEATQHKPQEPVDPYADLPGYIKQSVGPVETQFQQLAANLTLRASKAEAVAVFGKDAVTEMESAIEKAMRERNPEMPLLRAQMQNSDDPVGVAMQWHQRNKLVQETGGDVNAYKEKLQDELLKDPAFQAKVIEAIKGQNGSKPNSTVQIPPSLSKVGAAASPHDDPGSMADRDLYAHAIR